MRKKETPRQRRGKSLLEENKRVRDDSERRRTLGTAGKRAGERPEPHPVKVEDSIRTQMAEKREHREGVGLWKRLLKKHNHVAVQRGNTQTKNKGEGKKRDRGKLLEGYRQPRKPYPLQKDFAPQAGRIP